MTGKPSKRRFFAATADVADDFIQIASEKNFTLYGFLNQILKTVVELEKAGVSLNDAVQGFRTFKAMKELGYVPVPENLWYELVDHSLRTDPKRTMARFASVGEWLGKYALASSKGGDPVKNLSACLAPLTNDASEFSIDGSDEVSVRCLNTRYPASYVEPLAAILTKSVETLGYVCESRTASRGMILLSLRKGQSKQSKLREEILA